MSQVIAVGLGGFVGAILRYVVTGLVQRQTPGFLPAGTMCVNLIGCLVIGCLMTVCIERPGWMPHHVRLLVITGLLGSLTTFSTFGYETVELLHESEFRFAVLNVMGNLVVGCTAVWMGHIAVLWLLR